MRRRGGRVIRTTCCVVILCITLELYVLLPTSRVFLSPKSEHVVAGSQQYRVRHFAVAGSRWRQAASSGGQWTPCLALHATLSHAHHVARQAQAWSGPLSVALFAAGQDLPLLLAYIAFLRRCSRHVRERVSFHLVWPSEQPANETVVAGWDADCLEDGEAALRRLLAHQTRPVGERLSYPQNLARNTARLACPTKLSLCPDVDMLPPAGLDLSAALAELFSRHPPCHRCAYVLPVFELAPGMRHAPRDKAELRQLASRGLARPFHWAVYPRNQRGVRPAPWLSLQANASQLSVAYQMRYEWKAEPVYVAVTEDLPPFDEMFVGYGFTRNTQAYEMFASGWRFLVLDRAFLVHAGLQWARQRPAWRHRQVAGNHRLLARWAHLVTVRAGADPLGLSRKYPLRRRRF